MGGLMVTSHPSNDWRELALAPLSAMGRVRADHLESKRSDSTPPPLREVHAKRWYIPDAAHPFPLAV